MPFGRHAFRVASVACVYSSVPPEQLAVAEIEERARFGASMSMELFGQHRPPDIAGAVAAIRGRPSSLSGVVVRAHDGAKLVAVGSADHDPAANSAALWVNVIVAATHRRRGIGTQILKQLAVFAQEHGCSALQAQTTALVPAGEPFARALGAAIVDQGATMRLPLRRVDWGRMAACAAVPLPAGYHLVEQRGEVPESETARWRAIHRVTSTAPTTSGRAGAGSTGFDTERRQRAGGGDYLALAIESPDGELVAFHDLFIPPPGSTAFVVNTSVLPSHRRRGFARRLKAEMLLRMRGTQSVTEVRSTNGEVNEPIRALNSELGFEAGPRLTRWNLTLPLR